MMANAIRIIAQPGMLLCRTSKDLPRQDWFKPFRRELRGSIVNIVYEVIGTEDYFGEARVLLQRREGLGQGELVGSIIPFPENFLTSDHFLIVKEVLEPADPAAIVRVLIPGGTVWLAKGSDKAAPYLTFTTFAIPLDGSLRKLRAGGLPGIEILELERPPSQWNEDSAGHYQESVLVIAVLANEEMPSVPAFDCSIRAIRFGGGAWQFVSSCPEV
jgi:hypothetical protein